MQKITVLPEMNGNPISASLTETDITLSAETENRKRLPFKQRGANRSPFFFFMESRCSTVGAL